METATKSHGHNVLNARMWIAIQMLISAASRPKLTKAYLPTNHPLYPPNWGVAGTPREIVKKKKHENIMSQNPYRVST